MRQLFRPYMIQKGSSAQSVCFEVQVEQSGRDIPTHEL